MGPPFDPQCEVHRCGGVSRLCDFAWLHPSELKLSVQSFLFDILQGSRCHRSPARSPYTLMCISAIIGFGLEALEVADGHLANSGVGCKVSGFSSECSLTAYERASVHKNAARLLFCQSEQKKPIEAQPS
ncbi:hypothetical protein BOTBODRAFT_33125, partial [Botryobasidium botryosum FD-172 SS1]